MIRRMTIAAVLALIPLAAIAAGPQSRSEQIKMLQDQIDKLNTMSDADWDQHHAQNTARRQIEKNRKKIQKSKAHDAKSSDAPAQAAAPDQPPQPATSLDQFKAFQALQPDASAPAAPAAPAQPPAGQ